MIDTEADPFVRFLRFNAVGAMGIGVQLGTVALLVHGFGVGATAATGAGVTAALVHNFLWHVQWTWRDHMGPGASRVTAFFRFTGANGAVSLLGSLGMMPVLAGWIGLPAVPANLVTIVVCGLLNYWLADRVFRYRARSGRGLRPWAPRA